MLMPKQCEELNNYAYNFIEALHNTTLDKSSRADLYLWAAYNRYKGFIEGLLGKDYSFPIIPTSLISVNIMTQWIVGLTKAIKKDDTEQIDACVKAIVQTMEGNYKNVQN